MSDCEQPLKDKKYFHTIVKSQQRKCVPNWLIEVLEWIRRIEMANSSLSTSSWTFKQLCWPKLHGNVKPFKVKRLKFWYERDESADGNIRVKLSREKINEEEQSIANELMPIPNIAPPEYILGFEEIRIYYLDEQIMQFMKNILPLINDIFMDFTKNQESMRTENEEVSQQAQQRIFLEMFKGKIFGIDLTFCSINEFDVLVPGLLDQIQFISTYWNGIGDQLNWLANQNNYGNQKIVEFIMKSYERFVFIGHIIHVFCTSTQRSNIFIIANYSNEIVDIDEEFKFTLENQQTDEILTLYSKRNPAEDQGKIYTFIARYPKGEDQWKEEGEQKYWPLIQKSYPNMLIFNLHEPWEIKMKREYEHKQRKRQEREKNEAKGLAFLFIFFVFCPALIVIHTWLTGGRNR